MSHPAGGTPPTRRPALTRSDGGPVRAVVADDEVHLADLLRMALELEGWDVRTAGNGQEALTAVAEHDPDVVVLDVMMPGVDGREVVTRLRAARIGTPVLFLTARDAVADRIAGLEAGGDDYVTKPFDLQEVVVRLRGMARRHLGTTATAGSRLTVGDLVLDEDTHEVSRGGAPVELTATEFALLRCLMASPRVVLGKDRILDRVWGYDFGGRSSIVELYISYLRRKVDAGRAPMIHTVRGVGYTIRPAEGDTP